MAGEQGAVGAGFFLVVVMMMMSMTRTLRDR
jgi:hypothetical protein